MSSSAASGAVGARHLPLRTLILVRYLSSDEVVLCRPLADLSRTVYGHKEQAITELRLFLEGYLPEQRPEVQSRFSMPADTEVVRLSVQLDRDDLPRRVQMPLPVEVTCAVVPLGADRWVLVPALDHTVYLAQGDDLEETVGREIRRMTAARELTPDQFAALLPAEQEAVEPLELSLDRSETVVPGRARGLRRRMARVVKQREAVEILMSVGRPLNQAAEVIAGPPLCGRQEELSLLSDLLTGRRRLSVMLLGEHLSGKTALFQEVVRQLRQRDDGGPVFGTSASQLIAGMSGLGQWQERVQRVMSAAEALDAILYFDDLGELFGDHAEGNVDLAGAMRPFLDEEKVRLVGELSPRALDRLEHRHVGFMSALQRLRVPALDRGATRTIIDQRRDHDARRRHNRPLLSAEAVDPLMDLVDRYMPYQVYPGRALSFYEELLSLYEQQTGTGEAVSLGPTEVYGAFSLRTGVPEFLLRRDRALKLERILAAFDRRVVGQDTAKRLVAETVCLAKTGLQPPGRPLANLLFVGPTGVGKTEVARTLANFLFGSPRRMVRFDMSEYTDPSAPERLIRGNRSRDGLLTRQVRRQPFCVLLLDEIEKADPGVFDLLLQVLGEGRLTDAAGRLASFDNAIIIMTSNLGAAGKRAPIGLSPAGRSDLEYYNDQVAATFRPEFVGRLDRVVPFAPLSLDHARRVTRMVLARLEGRRGLTDLGLTLDISDAALARLCVDGYSEQYGARPIKQHLDRTLMGPLAAMLAEVGDRAQGATLAVRSDDEGEVDTRPAGASSVASRRVGVLDLELCRGEGSGRSSGTGLATASELRRKAERLLALEAATEVKEQIDYLEAQLAAPGKRKRRRLARDARLAAEQERMRREQARLRALWDQADAVVAEIRDAEEMTLAAVMEEEDPAPYVREAKAATDRLVRPMFELLTALRSGRNGAVLLVQELDDQRALDHWFVPLAEAAEARRWTLTCHVHNDTDAAGRSNWPDDRRWGPARSAREVVKTLTLDERPPMSLMVRVHGPYAGLELGLEAGCHAFPVRDNPQRRPMLWVGLLALRTALTTAEWDTRIAGPFSPGKFRELRRLPPARRYRWEGARCALFGGVGDLDVPLADYWRRHDEVALAVVLTGIAGHGPGLDTLLAERLGKWADR